jgi:hypothetical protein
MGARVHELSYSLVTGVVSGVVATFLVVVFRTVWQRILVPWYEERLYQGPKIEGVWLAEIRFSETISNKHRMQLKRSGYKIVGRTVCYEGYSEGNSYDIDGTFKNLTLTCTYQIDHRRRIERGSMVLMLVNDGRALKGYVLYYDDQTNSIMSAECVWAAEDAEKSYSANAAAA